MRSSAVPCSSSEQAVIDSDTFNLQRRLDLEIASGELVLACSDHL